MTLSSLRVSRAWAASVVLVLVAALSVLAPASRAGATTPSSPPVFGDAAGIHVVSATQLDGRQWDVQVQSAALGRAVHARVLLPVDYAQHPETRYPVLYLFHGTSGRASDWVNFGNAEATTAGLPLIVVMPDAGFDGDGGGWFTNWVDTKTALGPSQWETFHVDQLIPWVDTSLRTVASREGRAISGLSQGGFGSTSYAARHPDMFLAAGAFSGAPEIDRDPAIIPASTEVIEYTASVLDGVEPEAMFGPRTTNELNWAGHDPSTLSTNLRGMSLSLYTATGVPGPLDSGPPNLGASGIETVTHASTMLFHQHLQEEGIPSFYDDYVFGTHTFPYWARDLAEFVGPLMDTFAHPAPAPKSISYRSIDPQWSQWGWAVATTRPTPAFSGLQAADARGFVLDTTGTSTVTTPAFYAPGTAATVTYTAPQGGGTVHLTTDAAGRLRMTVPAVAGLPTSTTVTIQAPPAP